MRERIKPTRGPGGMHDDYRETHPAYAMIGASRVSSSPGAPLYGSDFLHQHYVVISIHEAEMARSISNDYSFATKNVIEVALSEAQWATFVSSMNIGNGVQATFQSREGAFVPGIDPGVTRRAQFAGEVGDTLNEVLATLDELRVDIEDGKGKKILREKVERALRELGPNLGYVTRQFDEHMERTVEKAKIEVNAHATQILLQTGIDALGGAPQVISLPDETETK